MTIDRILQALISMGLIYFLLSNLVSILFEWYSQKTKRRGKMLYTAIINLLSDHVNKSYGALLYAHPQIEKLKKNNSSPPQYISSGMFADALIDVIGKQSIEVSYTHIKDATGNIVRVEVTEERESDPLVRFELGVKEMNYSPHKELFRSFHERSEGSYSHLKQNIAVWYDDHMERVSGWYKVEIKKTLFFFGLLVSLVLNVDSFRLVNVLIKDGDLRNSLVKAGERTVDAEKIITKDSIAFKHDTTVFSVQDIQKILHQEKLTNDSINKAYISRVDSCLSIIASYSLPIGWSKVFAPGIYFSGGQYSTLQTVKGILFWLAGILVSSIALSFGAPFWFDVIASVVNIRRAGVKPKKTSLTKADNKQT